MSDSSADRFPVQAMTLPSGDQVGKRSLKGVRDRLNAGFEPSMGTTQISRLKSLSSAEYTSHWLSGDQLNSVGVNALTICLSFFPSASMTQRSPRSRK